MFEEYQFEKIKDAFKNNIYHVIAMNYEKKGGIKIFDSFDGMKDDLCTFQKSYIFNSERMFTIIKFSENDYRMRETVITGGVEKEIYLDEKKISKLEGLHKFSKIKVRIADNGEFQYTGLDGGERDVLEV